VHVVDLAAEFAAGHRLMFSRPLLSALNRVADKREKAVLFLNRRGFASFLLCRQCGFVPECDSCATSLTYHEAGHRLACHHCAATRPVPSTCPKCGSPYLKQLGAGTQRVAAELATLMPDFPLVRMDADTTTGKGGHERALAQFEALQTGALIGTQMIAKGLDYPEVTLVGVINADTTLHLPDFRAGERTYQLLEQVAGRAGRGSSSGEVIVQTYWPDHPAIVAAATHDSSLFIDDERRMRQETRMPPYGRLANVLVWGKDRSAVVQTANGAADAVRENGGVDWNVLGPSPCPLSRLKGAWRWHILVQTPQGTEISASLASALKSVRTPRTVSVAADIDPIDLL
jgi:primosomal protein N' (replication factor Y)